MSVLVVNFWLQYIYTDIVVSYMHMNLLAYVAYDRYTVGTYMAIAGQIRDAVYFFTYM